MIIIRENRRETVNSWKLSLHVRPTFSSFTFMYICIYTYSTSTFAIFGFNKREKFVPRAKGTSTLWKWKFHKEEENQYVPKCNILQLYIYPFLHTRAFSKILDSANGLKSIYIRRRLPRIFEFDLKIGLIPWRRTRNIRISGLARPKKRNIRRDEERWTLEVVGSKDRNKINFLSFGNVSTPMLYSKLCLLDRFNTENVSRRLRLYAN